MTRRILIGGLFHETHTFLEEITSKGRVMYESRDS
jgi:hypothetical protein